MSDFINQFRKEQEAFSRDLNDWEYMRRSRTDEEQAELMRWKGKESLVFWLKNITGSDLIQSGKKKMITQYTLPEGLLERARHFNDILAKDTGVPESFSEHDVVDFLHFCLMPQPKRVLDYAAGYGRQSFLLSQIPDCKLFLTDAVETSYFAQDYVAKLMKFPVWEYYDHHESLEDFLKKPGFGIVHYPTWHNDMIESRSIDLASFVWCIGEMTEKAAFFGINTVARVLKEGGYLYIRDFPNNQCWRVEKHLLRLGFRPVHFPWKLKFEEVNATPRVYRYLPNYLNMFNGKFLDLYTCAFIRSYFFKELAVRVVRFFRGQRVNKLKAN